MRHALRLTRMLHKQRFERERLYALLADVDIGHVAFVSPGGGPHVLPVAVARLDDALVWHWHGSTGSRWLSSLGSDDVAVGVTSVEALVVGRSRFENSFWYRSAVVYGAPRRLLGEEAVAALDALTERILPGRLTETRPASPRELAATTVYAVPLTDWVLKESREWPDDTPEDRRAPTWAGTVPVARGYGDPVAAPDVDPATRVPPSVRRLVRARTDARPQVAG